jgi:hypothetical protein
MQQHNGAGLQTFSCAYYDENDGILNRQMAFNDLFISLTVFAVLIC